jgi:branched-chain amino acid transport system permease protein
MARPRQGALIAAGWIVVVLLVVSLPQLGVSGSTLLGVELAALLALNASSVGLSFGIIGELNLSQVAVYAGGAYLTGYLSLHVTTDILVALVLSGLLGLGLGIVVAVPAMRVTGWTLAVASFFLVLLVPDIITIAGNTLGGPAGLPGIPIPTLLGHSLVGNDLYVVMVLVTALWFLVFRNLVKSRHGEALLVLKQSPVLARSLGNPVGRLRFKAYALSSVPPAIAGCLFAYFSAYVDPGTFVLALTINILASAVLGGVTSVYGVLIGSVLMEFLVLQPSSIGQYGQLLFGGLLIVCGLVFMGGIVGLVRRLAKQGARHLPLVAGVARWWEGPESGSTSPAATAVTEKLAGGVLQIDGVSKHFEGNIALRDVSMRAEPGKVTALIGPNGSGKTTLLNLISGFYRTDSGAITLDGLPLSGRAAHQIARAGVGRTFQTPKIPKQLTTLQVVSTGCHVRRWPTMIESMARLPRHWSTERADRAAARDALLLVGLADVGAADASALPLSSRRLVELARALASAPKVILVDEVASGLDVHEVEALGRLLRSLADRGLTIVLIEHNFDLVRSVADMSYALANGTVIATGRPTEVESDPAVQAQYFGLAGDDPPLDSAQVGPQPRDPSTGKVET